MRPASRALRKVLRFQVYLPVLRNEGRTSLCRPERQFPNKKRRRRRKASAVLSERQWWINHGCQSCCVQRGELLLLSPVLQACPYMPLSGVKSFGDAREGGCHRGSRHLQLSPSLMLACQQQLCRAARRLSSASAPSLLPPLPLLQLCCNLGTEMRSQCCFVGNNDHYFPGRLLSS